MKNKDLLKKLLIILGAIVGVVIIIFIVILIYRRSNSSLGYEKIKKEMVTASENYYNDLKENLNSGESISITDKELIKKGYLKDYSGKLKDGVKCTGKVTIYNNFDNMLYIPNLDCGNAYKDVTLSEQIVSDNENNGSNGGLFDLYGRKVFRGENVNNYLTFAGKSWTILSINEDGSIRMILNEKTGDTTIWDDRYNSETGDYAGFNNYETSRIKESIDYISSSDILLNDEQKAYLKPHDICLGARSIYETNLDYSVECSNKINNQMFSLLQVNEYLIPSLDSSCSLYNDLECTNYNYIYDRFSSVFMWTTTINSGSSYYAYVINGLPDVYKTNTKAYLFVVAELSPEVVYLSGDGTYENPYTIEKIG